MAEFCLECWKKLNGAKYDDKNYILSDDLDFCEGCREWKRVVVTERRFCYDSQFEHFTAPFMLCFAIIYALWKLITLPLFEGDSDFEISWNGKNKTWEKGAKWCYEYNLKKCGVLTAPIMKLYH